MTRWTVADIPPQQGRRAVVTGASRGLGFEIALALARAGADVVIAGRDKQKGLLAAEKIAAQVRGNASYRHLNLADLASIAGFAEAMAPLGAVDLLVNNAGVMALPTRTTTADEFEMQFGANYLGHFALTGRLLPLLRRSRQSRVVSLSSLAHRTAYIDFGDLQASRFYSPWKAYGQSKLAMLIFALELQRRSDAGNWNLLSIAAHPGWARTGLFVGPGGLLSVAAELAVPWFGQSAADGALPILFAATSAMAQPGRYYGPGGIGELRGAPSLALIGSSARQSSTGARLWEASQALTRTSFGEDVD